MQKKIEQIVLDLGRLAFELVALNTGFKWERIFVIEYQYVNSLKISDTTKTALFELIICQIVKKIWQKYCCTNLISVSDPLTYWLSISVLSNRFLGI